MGKRFAQIEFVTLIAMLFPKWSFELTINPSVNREEFSKMEDREGKEI